MFRGRRHRSEASNAGTKLHALRALHRAVILGLDDYKYLPLWRRAPCGVIFYAMIVVKPFASCCSCIFYAGNLRCKVRHRLLRSRFRSAHSPQFTRVMDTAQIPVQLAHPFPMHPAPITRAQKLQTACCCRSKQTTGPMKKSSNSAPAFELSCIVHRNYSEVLIIFRGVIAAKYCVPRRVSSPHPLLCCTLHSYLIRCHIALVGSRAPNTARRNRVKERKRKRGLNK